MTGTVIGRTSTPPLSCVALLETSRLSPPLPSPSLSRSSSLSLVQSVPRAPLSKKRWFSTKQKEKGKNVKPKRLQEGSPVRFAGVRPRVFSNRWPICARLKSVQDAVHPCWKSSSSYCFSSSQSQVYCHFAGGYRCCFKDSVYWFIFHSIVNLFVYSLYCSLVWWFDSVHSFIHSFVHLFILSLFLSLFYCSFVHTFILLFVRSSIHSFYCLLVHWLILLFICSFIHSIVRSFIHSVVC